MVTPAARREAVAHLEQRYEMALMEGGDHLEWLHFKLAYEVRSSCADAFNPFVVDDYHRIDTCQVFKRGDE